MLNQFNFDDTRRHGSKDPDLVISARLMTTVILALFNFILKKYLKL